MSEFDCTDEVYADRFVADWGNIFRYVPLWNAWMHWKDGRWQKDDAHQVVRYWFESSHKLSEIAAAMGSKKMLIQAERSRNIGAAESVLRAAQSDPRVITTPDHWDSDPWLLNVANGVLDLRTGNLIPRVPETLITKYTDVVYDDAATCPRFDQFMNEVFNGSQPMIEFVRRVFGVCLTGITTDQAVYILHGLGANGKSTLLAVLKHLLGDYHKTASASAFFEERADNNTNDALASLHGARAVTCSEPTRKRGLHEAVIKRISGSDPISARFLHGHFFEYEPTFKVLIAVNHKPRVDGQETGLWRRLKMVPFNVSFEGKADLNLIDTLKTEMSGILSWAVAGCLDWQGQGLNPPEDVKAAIQVYRDDMDELGEFLELCCILEPDAWVSSGDLYRRYTEWAEEDGPKGKERPSAKMFGQMLAERGLKPHRLKQQRIRLGIRLKTDAERTTDLLEAELDTYVPPPQPIQESFLEEPDEPDSN